MKFTNLYICLMNILILYLTECFRLNVREKEINITQKNDYIRLFTVSNCLNACGSVFEDCRSVIY